jgi:hypothetical protein
MCSGQCDQPICRKKLGKLGLSSSCLWRLGGRRMRLDIFLAWALLREGGLACSYQHTKQSHDL